MSILAIVSYIYLVLAGASALGIAFDVYALGHRQRMRVMEIVWIVNALYLGPVALWWYFSFGSEKPEGDDDPVSWKTVAKATMHCGAGCTLGDIASEWAIFLLGITIAGRSIWPELIGDFVLAYALGLVFQYLVIVPMRKLGAKEGLLAALKADTLSLVAFEVGLFIWMLLMALVFFHPALHPDSPVYWFMMQIGMAIGFVTSYPANRFLVESGLKERM